MFTSSYEDLRLLLLRNTAVETMAHVGPRAFDEVQGEKVNTTAFVLQQATFVDARNNRFGTYFRLVKEPDADAKKASFEQALDRRRRGVSDPRVYEYRQGDFAAIPGSPWVYWITPNLRALFQNLPKLEDVGQPTQGLATADNFRFLRYWWEVGIGRVGFGCQSTEETETRPERWYPHLKGGTFQRWYGNQEYIINYGRNGYELKAWADPLYGNSGWSRIIKSTEYYFRTGVTWSRNAGNRTTFRIVEGGFVVDVNGSLIPEPRRSPRQLLGLLNSTFCLFTKRLLNPTISFQVGDLRKLPIPSPNSDALETAVDNAIVVAKAASSEDETTYDFQSPICWPDGTTLITARNAQLAELKGQIDEQVFRLYGISDEDRKAIESELATPIENTESEDDSVADVDTEQLSLESSLSMQDLASQWIRYAVGVALGRFQPGIGAALGCGRFGPEVAARLRDLTDQAGIMVLENGHPDDLALRVLDILAAIHREAEMECIVQAAAESSAQLRDAIADYLAGEFFRDHVRRYRKRPIYWLIQSPRKNFSIYLFHEKPTPDTLSLLRGKRYVGGWTNRLRQEQNALSAAVLRGDRGARAKAGKTAELLDELQEFDRRLEAATRVHAKDKDGRDVMVRWEPELDDGVYINAAPLHELLPAWREVNPKEAWQELAAG
jgi:hypothetical protein